MRCLTYLSAKRWPRRGGIAEMIANRGFSWVFASVSRRCAISQAGHDESNLTPAATGETLGFTARQPAPGTLMRSLARIRRWSW